MQLKKYFRILPCMGCGVLIFLKLRGFQGDTSLRILHGMKRFSEDLDFILKIPDPEFAWPGYLQGMLDCFEAFGLSVRGAE